MRARTPRTLLLALISLTLLLLLAACSRSKDETPTPGPTAASPTAAVPEAGVPVTVAPAPAALTVESAPASALVPECTATEDGAFGLKSAPLPAAGIEPGITYLFCAVGAPAGAEVRFVLVDSKNNERGFTAVSQQIETATAATLSVRLGPDDAAGAWKLRAISGEQQSEISFNVLPATQPLIALQQPLGDNPQLILAAVGGLEPGGEARFGLYQLGPARPVETGGSDYDATLLTSAGFLGDTQGRADLELDVAASAPGTYLLLLLSGDDDLGDPPIVNLPEQEHQALLVEITRETAMTGVGPTPAPSAPSVDTLSTAIQPAAQGGGIPSTIQISIQAGALPTCQPANSPTITLAPDTGEIGNWWLGCASGFGPGETIQITVDHPAKQETQFRVVAGTDGATTFYWFSAPAEGIGRYKAVAESISGKADLSWTISAASRPHVLVYPHNYQSSIGGEINLAGFPKSQRVDLALYKLDATGQGSLIKQWQQDANKFGAFKAKFDQAFGLEPGQYAIVAQGGPAFAFPGVNLAASAIDFFAMDEQPDERYQFYTLYVGRVATASDPNVPQAPAEAEAPTGAVPPAAATLPEDTSGLPTCPGATAEAPAICLQPTTLPQGAFAYVLMQGFIPATEFTVDVKPPKGERVTLKDRVRPNGVADVHWYALPGEPLGEYKITVRGGGQVFNGSLTVVAATTPNLVIQPRTTEPGTPVMIGLTGMQPKESVILARYQSVGAQNGVVNFQLVDTAQFQSGPKGGVTQTLGPDGGKQGDLFLVRIYRPGQADHVAQAVYSVGEPLYLSYPFGWGQANAGAQ